MHDDFGRVGSEPFVCAVRGEIRFCDRNTRGSKKSGELIGEGGHAHSWGRMPGLAT